MSSTPVAALVIALTLSAVLLTSGVAKLRDARATRDAFVALRVPRVVPVGPSAAALPWVEVALGVLLLISPTAFAWVPAAAVLLLMLAYTALIARALRFEEPVSCSCFGSIGSHDVGVRTLARNVLLSVLAVLVLSYATAGGSVPASFADLDGGGWAALAAALAAALVAVLVVGPAPDARASEPTELLDYERALIPYGVLKTVDGGTATLAELAMQQARLVVVLNPGCGPCVRIGERLDGWAERLGPAVGVLAVYSTADDAANPATHGPELAVWEPELNVRRVLGGGAPTAVVLGADGYLAAGPATGEDQVVEMVEAVLAEIGAEPPQPSVP